MRRKTYDGELLAKLAKQEEKGTLYQALARDEEPPYLRFPLKRPEETEENWDALLSWADYWRHPVKDGDRPLWRMEEKRKRTARFGLQTLPVRIFVDTPADAFTLLRAKDKKNRFLSILSEVKAKQPSLTEWLLKYYVRIDREGFYPLFFPIAEFMQCQQKREAYLRELAIPGLDTKFLESHSFLVRTLWNALFPEDRVDKEEDLAGKLFIREVPTPNICVRSLDEGKLLLGTHTLFLSAGEIGNFQPPHRRIFITENKVNGYTFPMAADSLILFGMGYGVRDIAKRAPWLSTREVYYWGDMDSDGFNILSQLRHLLPQVQSFLMDRDTLLTYVDKSIVDDGNTALIPDNLTVPEKMAWKEVHDHHWRLEQERIPREEVEWKVEEIVGQGEER